MRADDLRSGAEHQVEGVRKHHLRAAGEEFFGRHALDRPVRADRHECRRFDGAARELEATAARDTVLREQLEFHARSPRSARTAGSGVTNIASP